MKRHQEKSKITSNSSIVPSLKQITNGSSNSNPHSSSHYRTKLATLRKSHDPLEFADQELNHYHPLQQNKPLQKGMTEFTSSDYIDKTHELYICKNPKTDIEKQIVVTWAAEIRRAQVSWSYARKNTVVFMLPQER